MTHPNQLCSDSERLSEFLQGRLSVDDEKAVEHHLEKCDSCRLLLEQTAADSDSWCEARELLTDDPWRNFLGETQAECDSDTSSVTLQVRQVLEMLQPTDDPDMLGRLGGYEVSGVVGSGGMGVVLKAADRSLDRTVAIKVLAPHLASGGASRKRFEREAKAAAAVIHSNVIAIHAVSKDTPLPFLVMPYVRGATLQKRIDNEGPLPLVDILRIGAQIASGLAAAHRQGLVHRDIKPANMLLQDGVERVAITDFGLARAVDDASVTRTGIIAGTPQYMSPEQASGEPVDHRTDLFSLGSVLYTLCTGRTPFRAESTFGILRRITDNIPRPIRDTNPETPPWLCSLICKLHAKSADDRYQSADEVAELLEKCLAHVQTPYAPIPQQLETCTKRSWTLRVATAAASLAVLAIIVIGVFVINGSDPNELPPEGRSSKTPSDPSSDVSVDQQTLPSTPTSDSPSVFAPVSPSNFEWDDPVGPTAADVNRRVMQLSIETQSPFADGFGEFPEEPSTFIKDINDEP